MFNTLIILLGQYQLAITRFVPAKSETAYSSVQSDLLNQKPLGKYFLPTVLFFSNRFDFNQALN